MKYYLILFMLGGTCISTFAQTDLVASGGDGLMWGLGEFHRWAGVLPTEQFKHGR
ncbi:MAG: hypothetical protein H6602_08615 [Flavobacteriales bacterium]|nr:hypothetical protein [Flavobacteriales bacterium]